MLGTYSRQGRRQLEKQKHKTNMQRAKFSVEKHKRRGQTGKVSEIFHLGGNFAQTDYYKCLGKAIILFSAQV